MWKQDHGDFTLGADGFVASIRASLDGAQFLTRHGLSALFGDFAGAFDIEMREAIHRTIFIGADSLSGSDFADTLGGSEDDDRLDERDCDDTLLRDLGNGSLIGGASADFHDGGEGIDTASYQGSIQSNQADPQSTDAGQDDVFTGIENLIGSNRVDIFGNSGENAI